MGTPLAAFWQFVRRAAARPRAGGGSALPPWLATGTPGSPLAGGWTDNRFEQVRHFRHWVYVAVDRVASKVAQAMPNVSVARDAADPAAAAVGLRPERMVPPHLRAKALVPLQLHEELEPVGQDHPLVALLRGANPVDTGYDLWYETVMYLLLTGSAYWWLPQNKAGLPESVWVIPSHWVWPQPGKDRVVGSYQLRPVEGSYTGVTIPAEDVVHFRKKSPVSKVDGYSPQSAVSRWVDAAESVDMTRWHVFRNGPMPQLKVEFAELNPSDALLDRIEARIAARYGGEHNAGRPMLVPAGAKVAPLWVTPRELDFRSSFDQLRDSILAAFAVPAVVAGITKNMTYGSVLAAQAGFCQFAVNPLLSFLGQAITEQVAARYDDRLRVWWADQTPDDPAVRVRDLEFQARAGALTPNEVRAEFGRKPLAGLDAPLAPMNAAAPAGEPSEKALRRAWRRARNRADARDHEE